MRRYAEPCYNACGNHADPGDPDVTVLVAPIGMPLICQECHFRDPARARTPFVVCACGDRECTLDLHRGPRCWHVVLESVLVVDGRMFSRHCIRQVAA